MRQLIACVVALAAASGTAHAQPGPGNQVQTCAYWEERIRFADNCVKENTAAANSLSGGKNTTLAGGDSKDSGMAGQYWKAVAACRQAKGQYQAKLATCRTGRAGGGAGGGAAGNAGGGPSAAELQRQQLEKQLENLARQGNQQAADAISRLRGATRSLGDGYQGAGPGASDIPGLPDAEWSDDSLADLGDTWPITPGGRPQPGERPRGNDPIDGSDLADVIDFPAPGSAEAAGPPGDGSPDSDDWPGAETIDFWPEGEPGGLEVPIELPVPAAGGDAAPTDPLAIPDYTAQGDATAADLAALSVAAASAPAAAPTAIDGVAVGAATTTPGAGYGDPGPDLAGAAQPEFTLAGPTNPTLDAHLETAVKVGGPFADNLRTAADAAEEASGCVGFSEGCAERMNEVLLRHTPYGKMLGVRDRILSPYETGKAYLHSVVDLGAKVGRLGATVIDYANVEVNVKLLGNKCARTASGGITCRSR